MTTCPPCDKSEYVDRRLGGARRCSRCGSEQYAFDMDHGWTVTARAEGEWIRKAAQGELGPIVAWLAGGALALPIHDARTWGEVCLDYNQDLSAWAAAFEAFDGERKEPAYGLFVRGVAILRAEAALRVDLPPLTFDATTAALGAEHYGTVAAAFDGALYVAPRRSLYRWERGSKPVEIWKGKSILDPLGGPFWGQSSPPGGPLYRLEGGQLKVFAEAPDDGARPLVEHFGDVTVLRWRSEGLWGGQGPKTSGGRTDFVGDDGDTLASVPSTGAEVRRFGGGWLTVGERDGDEVVPLTFRDASFEVVWRSPDRWPGAGYRGLIVSVDEAIELCGADRRTIERRSIDDGSLLEPPAPRTESPVIVGGRCGYKQGIWFEEDGERRWHLDASPEWVGSPRYFLAVGAETIHVVDAFTGSRSAPIPKPAESERVLGTAAHGGVYVTGGVQVTFVKDRVAEPWRPMPFPGHLAWTAGRDRLVFVASNNEPRCFVARRHGEQWDLEGVVEGVQAVRGPSRPRHWMTSHADVAMFVSETEWSVLEWPDPG